MTIKEAKQIRSSVREIKALTDSIQDLKDIQSELCINLEKQIQELEELKFKKTRGMKYV